MSRVDDEIDKTTLEWTFVEPHKVQHLSGFALALLSGSWQCPMDINPMIKGVTLSAAEIGRLIRDGLEFAGSTSPPEGLQVDDVNSVGKITPAKNSSGRPVLSLKKNKYTDLA